MRYPQTAVGLLRLAVTLFGVSFHQSMAQQQEDDNTYHFTSGVTNGRAAWVVDTESLPWIGSFEYLSSDVSPATVLMTVVDSSTGAPLGECSVMDADKEEWEHFVWTLTSDSLTCNVSDSNSSKVRFPLSAHPRTFSVRIQSNRGPRCLREVTVQNERPVGCPPHLRRNAFTAAGLVCGCPYVTDSTAETDGGDNPAFPIFDLQGGPAPPGVAPQSPAPGVDFQVSPCANVECLNNGTCVVGSDGQATCLCQNGFSGSRCHLDICATVPCANGGKCRANGSTAVCECPPHTKGILCEQIICEPACAQGECALVDGAPMCQCNQGFIGPNCNVIDVCIGDAACAVFGEHAKCTLDSASYTTVTSKVVNASYDCHCPHPQTGQWMDCMTLVLSSTPKPALGGNSFGSQEKSAEKPTTTTTSTTTPKVPIVPMGAHNVVTATAMAPRIITAPTTTTTTTSSKAPQVATNASQQMNFLPFSPNAPSIPVSPIAQPTTTALPSEEEEEESEETTTITQTVAPNLGFRPFPSAPVVVNTGRGSTQFPQPAPIEVSGENGERTAEEEEEENFGAGFETMTQENGPEPHGESTTGEPSTVEEEESEETTILPISTQRPMLPTGGPLWPLPNQEVRPSSVTPVKTTPSASAETTQSVLPFWMMTTTTEAPTQPPTTRSTTTTTTSTTTTTTTTTEEPETEEDESGDQEQQPTILPPVRGNNNNVPHEHAWPGVTQPPAIDETTKAVEPTGSASQSGTSAASIIVAIIAVCLIGMLLLAAAFFTMRYVRQSRKLHGKYNPAREEHALSAAYSLPMTHVSKEERLI